MRIMRWILLSLAVLIGLAVGINYFILDWDGRPFCHKQFFMEFQMTLHPDGGETTPTNAYPNINGKSTDSLADLDDNTGYNIRKWTREYRYVPGLRENDPGDLVLMYFDRPTRWTWHGEVPTIFKAKAWIIVPVDFKVYSWRPKAAPGEMSERVSLDEFRSRLKRTIDFVRTNERPNWQTIVAEHTKFLESIEHLHQ